MSSIKKRTNVKLAKIFYKYADRFNQLPIENEKAPEIEEDSYPPCNFSWFVDNKVAGMACPQNVGNLNYLADCGIKHLVTLSPERIPPLLECNKKIRWSRIPVKEFEAPTLKQIIKFIGICKNAEITGEAVGVHCRTGRARTGTMLACYLVFFKKMAPERAILTARVQRPGSCETAEQEKMVCHYHDCVTGTITKSDYRLVDDKLYFDFNMKYMYPEELTEERKEILLKPETFKEKLYKNADFIKKVEKMEAERKKRMKTMVINHRIYF